MHPINTEFLTEAELTQTADNLATKAYEFEQKGQQAAADACKADARKYRNSARKAREEAEAQAENAAYLAECRAVQTPHVSDYIAA